MNMLSRHSRMNCRKEIRHKIRFLQLLVRFIRNQQFSLCEFYGKWLEGQGLFAICGLNYCWVEDDVELSAEDGEGCDLSMMSVAARC